MANEIEITPDQRWRKKGTDDTVQIEPVLLNALRVKDGGDAAWQRGVSFTKDGDTERYVYVLGRADFLDKYELVTP